jgi:hypothetical protein
MMKNLFWILAAAGLGLSGCAVVPVAEPYPVYVSPPPPTVVVRPYGHYGPRHYHGHRHRYWR